MFGILKQVIPADEPKGKEIVEKMQAFASTPKEERAKTMKRFELIDWRWLEVIKVYDLATFARLMAVLVAAIGASITLLGILLFRR